MKIIAGELGYDRTVTDLKLDDLRKHLLNHPIFKPTTKLEDLAKKYKIKIIFLPKFHCELNPIEGVWCYLKQYVRKRTNCNFDTMLYLISESRTVFTTKQIYKKLWRRFWRVVAA